MIWKEFLTAIRKENITQNSLSSKSIFQKIEIFQIKSDRILCQHILLARNIFLKSPLLRREIICVRNFGLYKKGTATENEKIERKMCVFLLFIFFLIHFFLILN